MKYINLLTLVMLMIICGCGGGDPEPQPSEVDKVTRMLTGGGSWSLSSGGAVLVDGVDVTDELFPGFSIRFNEGSLTTTGTSPVWLRQDTWQFKDQSAKVIIRGQDQREITIQEISATQLKLILEWPSTTTDGGRQHSLKGKHEFILNN